jgi:SAM-dependent methyltransferase
VAEVGFVMETVRRGSHHELYRRAEIYDIAFEFKDFAAESEFMIRCHGELRGRAATSWLEPAAGPGRHTLEMARRGLRCTALDLSAEMVAYGAGLAAREGLTIDYRQGEMVDFSVDEPVDLAAILPDSITHVLDAEMMNRNLASVADALVDGGIYIVEHSHPADLFGDNRAGTEWEMTRDGLTVRVQWGSDDDPPVTQTTKTSVRLEVGDGDYSEVIGDRSRERVYTATEFAALVALNGRFDIVARYGAMDPAIDLHHPRAWRDICVLRKRRRPIG